MQKRDQVATGSPAWFCVDESYARTGEAGERLAEVAYREGYVMERISPLPQKLFQSGVAGHRTDQLYRSVPNQRTTMTRSQERRHRALRRYFFASD
jgi:hypothetical protein